MWPFTKTLSEEQKQRLFRRCSLALQTLHNCRQANGSNTSACANLGTQVVYCHSEVLSPKLAYEYQKCFRAVINSKGKLPVSACDTHIEAMKKSLRKYKVYPFK
ncbi:hypothetical protein Ndes2526B_g04927 [Nannochloris sp. 'desiccata']